MYQLKKELKHVAFIMDGNGRWAKKRGLPRHLGHKAACERLTAIFDSCMEHGIKVISLYAFSTENWNRPQDEIDHLFEYLEIFFNEKIDYLHSKGSKIIVSGDIRKLPIKSQETINRAIEKTKENSTCVINFCLNYGGKAEILKVVKEISLDLKNGKILVDEIDENTIEKHLYTHDLPNVDLLIRTSGEFRTSNFLPWQIAYAEFIFEKTYWPDFTPKVFEKCLKIYDKRNRRYGGLKNG